MKRVLKWLAISLAALLLLVTATTWTVFDTPAGLRLAGRLAQRLSSGLVTVGAVSGRFSGALELHDLKYTGADGTVVTVKRVHLVWRPRELLARRFHAEVLEVDGVIVAPGPLPNPAPAPAPTLLPTRLPLDVIVDALTLTGFELKPASGSGGAPFALARADFAGRWIGAALTVDRLETALPETGPVALSAQATMASERIDFSVLHLETRGDAPATVDVRGRLGFNAVASDLQLAWHALRWPLVPSDDSNAPPRIAAVTGSGHVSGAPADYRFEVQTAASTVPPTAAAPKIVATTKPKTGNRGIVKAGANTLAPAGSVSAPPPGDAKADAKSLTQAPRVPASKAVPAPPQKLDATLVARGSGGLHRIVLDAFDLEAGAGHVTAKGSIAWSPAVTADLDATIEKLDPALIDAALDGEINGRLGAKTVIAGDEPQVQFTTKIERSRLHGHPLALDARGEARGRTVTLSQAVLTSGGSRLEAKGQVTPPFAVDGRFDSPDLAALYPGIAGHAAFDFRFDGTPARPHLVTHGTAGAIKYGTITVAAVNWEADLDPEAPSKLSLVATDAVAGLKIRRVQLGGDGQLNYHRLTLDADTERGSASLAVAGGWDKVKREWGGQISESKLSPSGFTAWSLEHPTGLLLGQTRLSLEPACWVGSGRACANLIRNVNGDGFRSEWNVDALQLETFKPLLPKTLTLKGRLDGRGKLALVDGDIRSADGDLRITDGRLETKDAPAIDLETGSLRAEQSADGRLHAVLDFKLRQGDVANGGRADLAADVSLAPGAGFDQRALGGQVRLEVPDLAFVEPFVREARQVRGRLDGDLRLAGTPAAPKIEGTLTLADGHAKLVTPGIELKELTMKITGRGDGPLAVEGSAKSGEGTLVLAGTVEPSTAPPTADLTLKADNFQAAAIPAARAWIGADLHLVSDASGVKLTGEINVPKAEITPQGLGGSGAVTATPDQVIVGAAPPPEDKPIAITTNVRIALGDSVRLEGFGLKTRLEGAVTVFEEPNRETRGQGELRLVDGAYKAYGQDLTIDYGRLLFTGGAITEPAVEMRAVRKPRDDIEVGVRVRGTLDRPELTLDSQPAMTREQQLSWLVLGRPLESTSTSDRSAVSNAAMSLGLTGGDYLAGKIGKNVGLDTISVGSTPGEDASAAQLTLGKYLTPRLFVSYGLGLFQPGNSFKMLYDIGRGFKLQTETGVVSGGDVLYTVERK